MLKQIIALAGFLILYLFVIYQAHQLILLFYIFFPFLLVPVAFYMLNEARPLFFATTVAIGLILGFFLVKHPSLEMILFGFLMIAFLFGLSIYYRRWKGLLKEEETREHSALHVLEILKQKHDSRMDSLKHLEKQVSGLLNLFEIARDFNESLSFDEMADLLYKVVKVELPFARMVLLFQEKVEDGTLTSCSYCICAEGVQKGEDVVTESEKRVIREMRDPKPMWQHEGKWFFSLSTQGIVRAYLIVEGANPDDLAKFEVLGAYLTLQVKKVRLYEIVKELSIRDGLTGVFVRRHFLERFQEELRR
ncbi:MAG: hypothetical protein JW893_05100, partial [Candidatus Omnitrophica bacterium]|nr:hypothetical protein [Candidatus Omnitrophota bacterium]